MFAGFHGIEKGHGCGQAGNGRYFYIIGTQFHRCSANAFRSGLDILYIQRFLRVPSQQALADVKHRCCDIAGSAVDTFHSGDCREFGIEFFFRDVHEVDA